MKHIVKHLYLIKFIFYGFIGGMDYYHNNRFTIFWLLLAIIMLVFYILQEIELIMQKYSNK